MGKREGEKTNLTIIVEIVLLLKQLGPKAIFEW